MEDAVRFANISIIEGTGASQLGIGVAVARIVEIIARDTHAVIPVGSYPPAFGVTLSLPTRLGRRGVEEVLTPVLTDSEAHALDGSAATLRRALEAIMSRSQ